MTFTGRLPTEIWAHILEYLYSTTVVEDDHRDRYKFAHAVLTVCRVFEVST